MKKKQSILQKFGILLFIVLISAPHLVEIGHFHHSQFDTNSNSTEIVKSDCQICNFHFFPTTDDIIFLLDLGKSEWFNNQKLAERKAIVLHKFITHFQGRAPPIFDLNKIT